MFYGLGLDPARSAPAIIAVIVGFFVWQRHRHDRRARLFLALAVVELAFGVPLVLAAAAVPAGQAGVAAVQGLVVAAGLVSTIVFLHFASAFPHARPWIRRGSFHKLYWIAIITAAAYTAVTYGLGERGTGAALDVGMMGLGLVVVAASLASCVIVYRSYREMTADERSRYRVPITGVIVAIAAAFIVDLAVSLLFGMTPGLDSRYVLWTLNLVAMTAELLLPLFFFMAAVKYRLLDHHSQDYVAKL